MAWPARVSRKMARKKIERPLSRTKRIVAS
jgi:hypothetical protein